MEYSIISAPSNSVFMNSYWCKSRDCRVTSFLFLCSISIFLFLQILPCNVHLAKTPSHSVFCKYYHSDLVFKFLALLQSDLFWFVPRVSQLCFEFSKNLSFCFFLSQHSHEWSLEKLSNLWPDCRIPGPLFGILNYCYRSPAVDIIYITNFI